MEVEDKDKTCRHHLILLSLFTLVWQQYSEIDMEVTQNQAEDNSYRRSRAQNRLYGQGLENLDYLHDDGRPRYWP